MKGHTGTGAAWMALGAVAAVLSGRSNGPVMAKGTASVQTGATTTTVDPWAVPAVIDLAYLQRVMDRLDQSLGDALRELVAAKSVDPKIQQILQAIYAGPELSRTSASFAQASTHLQQYRQSPGDPITRVTAILAEHARCVYFSAFRSFAPAFTFAPKAEHTRGFIGLRRTSPLGNSVNPTAWSLVLDATTETGLTPGDPCA